MGGVWYQEEAKDIVDYQLYQLPGISNEWFRGPAFERTPGEYVSFLGAAQTFGTFVRYPFSSILAERLPRPTLNLGIGGAGPGRFLIDHNLIRLANAGACTVVQIMSGRSAENSEYEVLDGCSAMRPRGSNGPWQYAEYLWRDWLTSEPEVRVARLLAETQSDWVQKMRALLNSITTPKVLVWISRRRPSDYPATLSEALSEFPHFVTPEMLEQIKLDADAFVDATSSRGSPQVLSSRVTGMPTDVKRPEMSFRYQTHYPSPEMHEDIANALFPVLRTMLPKPW